ncbi:MULTISPECIES: ABC transporter substrate-binding protein [Streptomyces]|uniref:peptide ABC transporter substrate-binding protein n=1 Tax=Streptomyces TaxID=1883 RepID=UPI00136B5EBC|nr:MULTISPECIES: ABC transporter substrate-binding protein [Streptomyces]NDZ89625.1 ABC transporter substrate-binding protein [Streptomyces sp. SID10115]NEA01345.1 ABC transporter substrate-binding protein [Streptomyces sp. SID10116]MYY87416.1 peptide ABC transporter substrate-binding protein [Streptomyces sp. SID335]MYZ18713.1 peptide ABC transporter substrate-binding protein [Streptomyces sp. SID337]NEB45488.1 ABC transporter substrate-binding protein [Streptomyces sp. SID339]
MAGVGALVLTMSACGGGETQRTAADGGTFRFGLTEPAAIDPGLASETTGLIVSEVLFSGLYRVNPKGELEPRLATSASTNDDCTQWKFTIKGGTKFTNGETVDAESLIRGWNRTVSPALASDVSYHLDGIKGYEKVRSGKAKRMSGLTAPDATSLRVDLSASDCEFDKKTAHTAFSPIPEAAAKSDKEFADLPIGNGPFKMAGKWDHNKKISLVRNDAYGLKKAKLGGIDITLVNSQSMFDLEYQGFQTGIFDYAHVPPGQLSKAEAQYKPAGKWMSQDVNGMNYLLPITDQGPLKSRDARLAISYAIDRQAITKGLYKGYQRPASSIVPPALPKSYQDGLCTSCLKQDAAKAKAHAKKAGLKPGDELSLVFNTGVGHDQWIQAAAKQIEDTLGLKVKVKGTTFTEGLEKEQSAEATGLFRYSWGADYPTPDNYLYPLLHSNSIAKDKSGKVMGDNRSRYHNPEFDELVERGRATKDEKKRIAVYKQAEKVAMDDMALIPTFQRSEYRLADKKKFAGLDVLSFGESPYFEGIELRK